MITGRKRSRVHIQPSASAMLDRIRKRKCRFLLVAIEMDPVYRTSVVSICFASVDSSSLIVRFWGLFGIMLFGFRLFVRP
jgi:hypothetical protein